MGIVEDIKRASLEERPHLFRKHRNVAIAFDHYLRGRISLLLLAEVVDMYGTTGNMVEMTRSVLWTGRRLR